jgi:hypothetical protein
MKISKPEYLEKALLLNDDEQQRILSRMSGKLPNRLLKEKLSVGEAIAIQLEIEDEQLAEWRKNWEKIRKQDADKKAKAERKLASKNSADVEQAVVKKSAAKATAEKAPAAKPAKPAAKTKTPARTAGKPAAKSTKSEIK